MFIQTEQTPNPATLKFLPGQTVLPAGTADFTSPEQAQTAPLARRLFALDGVSAVFLGRDFITVTKQPDQEWHIMKPAILGAIMDHFLSGLPAMDTPAGSEPAAQPERSAEDGAIIDQIQELLESRVRPAVAQDGGDIVFHDYQDGVVFLHMRGACAGCPSSTATLKMGIENMLRHYVPEVTEVRAI